MTPEFILLSFLNSSGVGVYVKINDTLKKLFPFTNNDNDHYEFNIHATHVKEFLNRLSADNLISIKGRLSPFGSRANGKNNTLDDTPIFATITSQGYDRLKIITPAPKKPIWSFITTHPTLTFWGLVLTGIGILASLLPFTCNNNTQPTTSTTQKELLPKDTIVKPSSQLDTFHKKK